MGLANFNQSDVVKRCNSSKIFGTRAAVKSLTTAAYMLTNAAGHSSGENSGLSKPIHSGVLSMSSKKGGVKRGSRETVASPSVVIMSLKMLLDGEYVRRFSSKMRAKCSNSA